MYCFSEKSPKNPLGIFFLVGGEKITKYEEKSLKTGNLYRFTDTLGSNLTYLATLGQVSMGVKLFIGTPGMPIKLSPGKKRNLAMFKCMVSMATHDAILLNGCVPTKQPYLSCFSV